jgi:N,N'-diacetyllegionaminate synthase
MNNRTIIIAEAGVNHNGSMELAKKLIDAAVEADVDYVKFQTFKSDKLVSNKAPKAEYQKNNTGEVAGTQLEMLKKLELSVENHHELVAYCKLKGIKFMSTPFDMESADFLHELGLDFFKVSSGDITNLPLLSKIAGFGKKVIFSTGMSTMEDIKAALKVIVSQGVSLDDIFVLHCNTEYPTPFADVNLRAMLTIERECGVKAGYSDHTLGIEVPIAAVAMGAKVIEKHFTLDKNMAGPDHKASLDPAELKSMVLAIRNIEKALGSEVKQPSESERKNMVIARKSVHLLRALSEGEVVLQEDLEMLRPGDGISPMEMEKVIGKKVKRDLAQNHKLMWEDLL